MTHSQRLKIERLQRVKTLVDDLAHELREALGADIEQLDEDGLDQLASALSGAIEQLKQRRSIKREAQDPHLVLNGYPF